MTVTPTKYTYNALLLKDAQVIPVFQHITQQNDITSPSNVDYIQTTETLIAFQSHGDQLEYCANIDVNIVVNDKVIGSIAKITFILLCIATLGLYNILKRFLILSYTLTSDFI